MFLDTIKHKWFKYLSKLFWVPQFPHISQKRTSRWTGCGKLPLNGNESVNVCVCMMVCSEIPHTQCSSARLLIQHDSQQDIAIC